MKQTDMKRTWIVIGMVALFCSILFSLYRNPSSGTSGENLTPWDQQTYIWQRVWTPQHQDALLQSHELFSGLRVLGPVSYTHLDVYKRQANWALSPVIMCLICMVLSAAMYYPFLKAYERTLLKQEEDKQANELALNS